MTAPSPLSTELVIGQQVRDSGEVKWGDQWIRVASHGVIEEVGPRECLVTLDQVGNDLKVCTFVERRYILA